MDYNNTPIDLWPVEREWFIMDGYPDNITLNPYEEIMDDIVNNKYYEN